MKNKYNRTNVFKITSIVPILIELLWLMPVFTVQAQELNMEGSVLWVEWQDDDGLVKVNALRDAIENDTDRPDDRIYGLRRGGYYWLEDRIENDGFHLRIVGEEPGSGPLESPAVIQMVVDDTGEPDGRILTGLSSVTMKNLWITGRDDVGSFSAYQPIQIDASNSEFLFVNNIIEHSNFALIAFTGTGNTIEFRDNIFRNLIGRDQIWEGRGISVWADQESVIVENNTFFNIGMTALQIEGGSAEYVRFNHNTIVGLGRNLNAGNWWREAYFANNLIVNGFWHGENPNEYTTDPPREADYAGMFSIGTLPSSYGTDATRRIVLANNSTWRDPEFYSYYADSVRAQPFYNEITAEWFDEWDAMVVTGNIEDANPGFEVYPDNVGLQIQNIMDLRSNNTPGTNYRWDPGRDTTCDVCINWPLPENFAYSNSQLMSAGTDGLPLGDLNWFPDAKAQWEANKDEFIQQIEDLAGEPVELDLYATFEAEDGSLDGDASLEVFDGFAYFSMDGGGFIHWEFELEEAGTHDIRIHTHMRGNPERGQYIEINGVNIRNADDGGYFFSDVPTNEWFWEEISESDLIEGTLGFVEGTNTIEIRPNWGWQRFATVEVVNSGGTVIANLLAVNADYDIVSPVCQDADYCASNFRWAALGYEGGEGSVSWNVESEAAAEYLVRVFYNSPDGTGEGELRLNGDFIEPLSFDDDANLFDTFTFTIPAGSNALSVATSAGVDVDYLQVYRLGTGTSVRPEIPVGYNLSQNYPNPFNPTTNISFEIPEAAEVRLDVFNVLGQRVAVLANGHFAQGVHHVAFDGSRLASGVYIYRIQSGSFVQARKMVLIK